MKLYKWLLIIFCVMIHKWIPASFSSLLGSINNTLVSRLPAYSPEAEGFFCTGRVVDNLVVWTRLHDEDLPNLVKDKRVLVMVHGLFGFPSNMNTLFRFLESEVKVNRDNSLDVAPFDVMLAYKYNTYPSLYNIGDLFANQLTTITENAKKTYLIAHSMGGLVSRYALEQKGLGEKIKHLITIGTPHQGVPQEVFKFCISFVPFSVVSVTDMYAGNDLDNEELQSGFLRMMNGYQSLYYDNAHYYTIAGSEYLNYNGIAGRAVKKLYDNFGNPDEVIDGIVSLPSAHSLMLEKKSKSWQENPNQRVAVPLNHFGILGMPKEEGGDYSIHEPLNSNISLQVIKRWIQSWDW